MEHQTLPIATTFTDPPSGFHLDIAGLDLNVEQVEQLAQRSGDAPQGPLYQAFEEMQRLENGAVKNPDEQRQVTHFSDRLTYPETELFQRVEDFALKVRNGQVGPPAGHFDAVVVNGIGGSALGPQLMQYAVNGPYWNELSQEQRDGWPRIYFLDNTDPAGVQDLLAVIDPATTLVISVSKSGGTRETHNNQKALEQAYVRRGLKFGNHAVAVTMAESKLDKYAKENGWLDVFPMAESIGGRTSETNIVGHLPAALAGIDFRTFLKGATHMDELTRSCSVPVNPAYMLACAWYITGNGRGDRNMVIVPYSDRLLLFSRYLQQLVMESLGKEYDLDGNLVNQGLTVYGNKGGTDAHAYIQQLNDGRDDFFVTFIERLRDAEEIPVGDDRCMGDDLHAFKSGLVRALRKKNRKVIDIHVPDVDPYNLGLLIALYERTVAVYAELIGINAFHQPGVEAYKQASKDINALDCALREWLTNQADAGWEGTAADAGQALGRPCEDVAEIDVLLSRYALSGRQLGRAVLNRKWVNDRWVYTLQKKQA